MHVELILTAVKYLLYQLYLPKKRLLRLKLVFLAFWTRFYKITFFVTIIAYELAWVIQYFAQIIFSSYYFFFPKKIKNKASIIEASIPLTQKYIPNFHCKNHLPDAPNVSNAYNISDNAIKDTFYANGKITLNQNTKPTTI